MALLAAVARPPEAPVRRDVSVEWASAHVAVVGPRRQRQLLIHSAELQPRDQEQKTDVCPVVHRVTA